MEDTRIIKELGTLNIQETLNLCTDRSLIIFDMDGTILNSEPLHWQVIQEITNHQTEYSYDEIFGMSDNNIFELLKGYIKVDLKNFLDLKNKRLLEIIPLIDSKNIFMDDMHILLTRIKNMPIKLALVTASEDVITNALLKKCKVLDLFDIIITRQDVKETKPSPEPYQLALKMLKISKENSVIFEDSPTGIESAKRAEIDTIKVTWYENY